MKLLSAALLVGLAHVCFAAEPLHPSDKQTEMDTQDRLAMLTPTLGAFTYFAEVAAAYRDRTGAQAHASTGD